MKKAFLLLAGAALIVAGCKENNSKTEANPQTLQTQETNTATADALPSFTMQNGSGKTVSLQSLKGKKVFVNLWATWCPPCRYEMPSIAKLYRSVDTTKVAFVMLSLDNTFDKAIRYTAKNNFPFPVYYPAENLPALFNVPGIPATFIFNEKGEMIKKIEGSENYDTDAFRKMLQ